MGKPGKIRLRRLTIIEAVVAIFVMGLVAAGLISLMTFTSEISGLMDRRQICLRLAVRRTEEIRNRPFTEVAFFAEDEVRINRDGQADANGEYWRDTVISEQTDRSCHVTVTVSSRGGFLHKPTNYQLSTVVVDYDLIGGQPE